jgi:hypothetical protein
MALAPTRIEHCGQGTKLIDEREEITNLLLPFWKVEKHEFVIRKATFGEGQADTISVGRTAKAV